MIPITSPGIYQAITAQQYHADCCATPSLSSTIAKLLVSQSPAHAHHAHPRLGGAKEDGDDDTSDLSASKAKALGELIHRLVLVKGADIVVIEEDSYRTSAAKAQKAAALNAGHLPVLAHKLPEAQAAADAARRQLDEMGLGHVFRHGMKEVVIVWQTPDGVWCRAMIDNLIINEDSKTAEIFDLKTVGRSSHPEACASQISKLGYDLSLEFYHRGLITVRPDLAGRVKRRWAFLEVAPPYAVTPVEISGEWEMAAAVRCDRAIAIWKKCLSENRWPFYVSAIERLTPKPWDIADAFMQEDE